MNVAEPRATGLATSAGGLAASAGGPAGPPADTGPLSGESTSAGQLGLAFKRAMVAVRRLRGRETQRTGQLSFAQYGLLHELAGRGDCSARELAELADLSPATVTQMLEHLEADGLVTRKRSEHDRRVVLTVLTEHGAGIVDGRRGEMESHWRHALADFSERDLEVAARVLSRVADLFEALSPDAPAE